MVEMDTPTGTEGAESIWFVAPTAGQFTVEVRPFEGSAGRYELRADALREATPDDAKRVQMQALFLEATRLGLQRTPDAQQSAIGKFREAAALARSVGERDMAALSVKSVMGIDIGVGLESVALPSPSRARCRCTTARATSNAPRTCGTGSRRPWISSSRGWVSRRKVYLAVLAREHWTDMVFSGAPITASPTPPPRRVPASYACRPRTTRSTSSADGASRRICRTRR